MEALEILSESKKFWRQIYTETNIEIENKVRKYGNYATKYLSNSTFFKLL